MKKIWNQEIDNYLNSIYKNWLKYAINYFKNKMNTKIEEALKVSEDILNYLN